MRKWLWLLALPYVVWHSTSAEPYWAVATDIYDGAGFAAADCHSQESCDDLAYAMNEAHKQRTQKSESLPNGCYKDRCNTCCPAGHGTFGCTAMFCGE